MNAIFGVFHQSGDSSVETDIHAMGAALRHRAIDGLHHLISGPVAIGCALMTTTPEDEGIVLPAKSRCNRFAITADVRLDNRCELSEALGLTAEEHALPDHEFLLRAWEKWGTATPNHLLGDFAFVIWNRFDRSLHCVTSHLGGRAFYYWEGGGKFVFASEIKALLAASGVPSEPDLGMIAGLGDPLHYGNNPERTFYRNIRAMPAAAVMTVTPAGRRTEVYWQPAPRRQFRISDEEECIEEMRGRIFAAVKSRLRTRHPPICLLSGGLDSSSITAVAAHQLPAGERLRTLSVTLRDKKSEGAIDERAYIDEFAGWSNLDRHFVHAEGRGPFDDLETLIRGTEEPQGTSRHYLYSEFAAQARSHGSRVILDGCYGELGPSQHSHEALTEMFLTGQWVRAARELRAQAGLESVSPWTLLRFRIVRPLIPPGFGRLLGLAQRRDLVSTRSHPFIRAEFTRQHSEMTDSAIAERIARTSQPKLFTRAKTLENLATLRSCRGRFFYAGYEHAELAFPFLDRRVIEFAMDAPVQLKQQNGYRRLLLRQSMAGTLPDNIRWRTTKEPFSPDYKERYNRQRASIRAHLDQISPADPVREIVDVSSLRKLTDLPMTSSRGGGFENFGGMQIVPRGLFLIAFLRQFRGFEAGSGSVQN